MKRRRFKVYYYKHPEDVATRCKIVLAHDIFTAEEILQKKHPTWFVREAVPI